jgi:hypothetical protein
MKNVWLSPTLMFAAALCAGSQEKPPGQIGYPNWLGGHPSSFFEIQERVTEGNPSSYRPPHETVLDRQVHTT